MSLQPAQEMCIDTRSTASAHPRHRSQCFKWTILACGSFLNLFTMGFVYSLGVMFVEILDAFGSPRAQVAMVQSVCFGTLLGAGVFAGGLIAKYGPGPFIIIGAVVSCFGLLASSFAHHTWVIVLCTGVVTGVGSCFGYAASFVAVGHAFTKRRSAAVIGIAIGTGFGPFLFPLLFEILLNEYGWRGAFMICSGLHLNCIIPGLIIYYIDSRRYTSKDRPENSSKHGAVVSMYKSVITDGVFLVLVFMRFLLNGTLPIEYVFLVDKVVSSGFQRTDGSILISVIGIASIAGRIVAAVFPLCMSDWLTMSHWIYLHISIGVAHLLYVQLVGYWEWFGTSILYGIAFGISNGQTAAVILEAVSIKNYSVANGIALAFDGIGAVVGGFFGGYINDVTGSYDVLFYSASGVAVFSSVVHGGILFYIKTRRPGEIRTEALFTSSVNEG